MRSGRSPRHASLAPALFGVIAVGAVLAAGGCNLYRPGLFEPRTIEQQRYSATLHDPFADPDLGPEVVGNRPRDFQNPYSEHNRTSWWRDFRAGNVGR